jgi:Rrf2 family nitric oxide-sensitive transcriptional repressor
MQLTQHTDFGLRLLIVLARREGEAVSVPAFAAEQGFRPTMSPRWRRRWSTKASPAACAGAAASRWRARRTDQRGAVVRALERA